MLAINQKTNRLPGFRFEAFAPAREDVLPRMDVALFVGFAASGPVGIPVAVESAEQFKAIFGDDLPLVLDRQKSETVYACLAPTVRAFFRNGGRRCWILRVARLETKGKKSLNRACYNFFPLDGLAAARFAQPDEISPVFARARSKGSWSDDLQIGTATLSRAVNVASLTGTDDEKNVTLEIGASESISRGDLLKITFTGKKNENFILLAAVDELKEPQKNQTPSPPEKLPEFGKRFVRFVSRRFVWLKKPAATNLPGTGLDVQIALWTRRKNADSETSPAAFLDKRSAVLKFEKTSENATPDEEMTRKATLVFKELPVADAPPIGSLLFAKLKEESFGLQVEAVNFGTGETTGNTEIVCRAIGCQRKTPPGKILQAALLTFEIRVKKDRRSFVKLSDLAFNSGHQRFWGDLPTDEEWYHFFHETGKNPPAWTQNAESSNFPLAGDDAEDDTFYFPLFAAANPKNYLGAIPLPGTKLQRDGLAEFDEDLFLDSKLKNTGTGSLLGEAEFIRYLSPRPRSLWGIHSALLPEEVSKIATESLPSNPAYTNYSLEECTIIAVPDAIHRGWSKQGAPVLSPPEILPAPVFSPPLRPDWWHFQDCLNPDIKKVSQPPAGQFLDCRLRFVEAPKNLRVREAAVAAGKFTLGWESSEEDEDLIFVLEESTSPKFEFFEEIYRGAARHLEISKQSPGVYFYRLRAEIGRNFSDWSIGLAVRIPEAENWALDVKYEPDVLLAVQRALLRMCAARGDLFAVLNLPEHFDEREAFAHVGTLRATKGSVAGTADVEPFSADETRALSFGAIYHPWLLTREDDLENFRNIPPDGAICGTFAGRAVARGAWIAPANEKLQGVLGLAKTVRREKFLDFQNNLINLVRQEPRGFLVLDSDTLCGDADLRLINVRRLLSLLRRLATKHGARYVFEPNNESFRRQVQRGFAELLDLMFKRGAFAGTTPANSYQVVVSETLNNFQSAEQGRFIVELRVAPSLPLKFVTIRLMQAGDRSTVIEVL